MSNVSSFPSPCPPQRNSTGVMSLYTVLKFCAEDFCRATNIIAQFRQQVYAGVLPSDSAYSVVGGELGSLQAHCEALGLSSTLAQLKRVKEAFIDARGYPPNVKDFADAIMEISTRLVDELEAKNLYAVAAERNIYIKENRFAKSAVDRLPDAIPDMDEAARCFAFERPTATIFHLMRVTEYALNAIADLLGIQDHNPTWEPIIRKIDAELKLDYSKRQYKGDQDLLANMSTHLHAVKTAWRNKTMHVEKINTMEHAKEIYDATCGLMRYMGDNLPKRKLGIVQTIRGKLGA